jgi:polysaccharide export outer membrane protein
MNTINRKRTYSYSTLITFLIYFVTIPLTYAEESGYRLNPGDELEISVWGDKALERQVVVLPDGNITFPLAGRLKVQDLTSTEVEQQLAKRLEKYVPDPLVTVTIKSPSGHRIYLVGKVQTPGAFTMPGPMTVLQALSLGGGLDKFADVDHILIIRKTNGVDEYLKFNYSEVASGKDLKANIVLQAGDVILVP